MRRATTLIVALLVVLTGFLTAGPAVAVTSGLKVTAGADPTRATLTWKDDGAETVGFRVCRNGRDSDGGGAYCTNLPASAGSFEFTKLLGATAYRFSVTDRSTGAKKAVSYRTPATPALTIALGVDARNSKQPYAAYNSVGLGMNAGGYDCQLYYHEYAVTEGCGGAWFTTTIGGLATYPGGLQTSGYVSGTADFGRTFGCRLADGTFIQKLVLREDDTTLSAVYASSQFAPGAPDPATATADPMTIRLFRNFDPVDFACEQGVKTQLGLRVSDVRVTVTSDTTGAVTKGFAGPFYS